MIIAHQEPTAATSYIMPPSLCIENVSIKVKSLLFPFLKRLCKAFRRGLRRSKLHHLLESRCRGILCDNYKNKNAHKKTNDTWKQSIRSPGRTATHSEDSHGRDRCLTCLRTLTHSSSSGPKPANRTLTSWNGQQCWKHHTDTKGWQSRKKKFPRQRVLYNETVVLNF